MLNMKYDIIGSFLRTQTLKDALEAYSCGNLTQEQLTAVEDAEVAKLVEKETTHGLTCVSDGEYRRRYKHLDWLREFEGFMPLPEIREHHGHTHQVELGKITGKISYDPNRRHPEIEAFDFLLKESKKYPGVDAKKCIPGPNMILVYHYLLMELRSTPFYGDNMNLLIDDIGTAYQAAIQDLYNHGCRCLQIDDISWSYLINEDFVRRIEGLGYEKEQFLDWFRRLSAKALENHPEDMLIAAHFCKGGCKGRLSQQVYSNVASILSQLPYDGFFVEYDDERCGSFEPWSVLKGKDATFVAGLISTKNPELENKDELKSQYEKIRSIVGEHVALSTQCGFACCDGNDCLDEETQWKKIDLLTSCGEFISLA